MPVASKKIPSITIETSDYDHISKMNNHAVIHVFMNFETSNRHRSLPAPDTYNSYIIRRYPNQLIVCLIREASEVFQVIFIPAREY